MSQRILVFESDATFAADVQANFVRLGAQVDVVSDGHEGIERATRHRPDLILLSIELPSMNGFLVCKKLKKHAELKQVPLIILSSDANAEEIFAQHRKLRTRAEDYVRKPVRFDDLLSHVQSFVAFEAPTTNGSAHPPPNADRPLAAEATMVQVEQVDAEIDAFADDAFDSLLTEEEGPTSSGVEPPLEASEEVSDVALSPAESNGIELADIELDEVAIVDEAEEPLAPAGHEGSNGRSLPPPLRGSHSPSATESQVELHQELTQLRQRYGQLEEQVARFRERAEVADRLQRELEEARSAAARTSRAPGGVSSREFLDLRETLNQKDKEILALKDEVSRRDKDLFELRDTSLSLERGQADLQEQKEELEQRQAQLDAELHTLRADREASGKREEDLRARLQRAEESARTLDEQLEGERGDRAQEIAGLKQQYQAELDRLGEAHSRELGQRAAEAALAEEKVREKHSEELRALRDLQQARAEQQQQSQQAELRAQAERHERRQEEALRDLESQHAQAQAEAAIEWEARKSVEIEQLRGEYQERLEQHVQALQQEQAATLAEERERNGREIAILGRKLSETERAFSGAEQERAALAQAVEQRDDQLSTIEARRADLSSRFEAAEAERSRLAERIERARLKFAQDQQLLERARRAMAIGLGLLEDQKRTEVDLNQDD